MISHGKYETDPLYCHVTVSYFCQIITSSLENVSFCLRLTFLRFLWQLIGNWPNELRDPSQRGGQ